MSLLRRVKSKQVDDEEPKNIDLHMEVDGCTLHYTGPTIDLAYAEKFYALMRASVKGSKPGPVKMGFTEAISASSVEADD